MPAKPSNPFTGVAWDPLPPIAFEPDDSVFDGEPDPDVSESLRETFRAFAAYANDDGVCWPSDQNVADDLGVCRETVTRRRLKLQAAGWMRVLDKWWSKRTKWQVNVVELLALHLCPVSDLARKRITRRAHSTVQQVRNRVRRGRRFRDDHTKGGVKAGAAGGRCDCRGCREDRADYVGPNPGDQARHWWRPTGPRWREQLAMRLSSAGRDPAVAYELEHRLDPLPVAAI